MTQPPPPEKRTVDLEADDEVAAVLKFFSLAVHEVLEKMSQFGGRAEVDAALAVRLVDKQGEWPSGWLHIRTVGEPDGDPAALAAFYEEAARQAGDPSLTPTHPPIELKPEESPNG